MLALFSHSTDITSCYHRSQNVHCRTKMLQDTTQSLSSLHMNTACCSVATYSSDSTSCIPITLNSGCCSELRCRTFGTAKSHLKCSLHSCVLTLFLCHWYTFIYQYTANELRSLTGIRTRHATLTLSSKHADFHKYLWQSLGVQL